MADPLDLNAMDNLRFQTGRRIEPTVATLDAVQEALDLHYPDDMQDLVAALPRELRVDAESGPTDLERATRAAPVVRLVDSLIRAAVEAGASDIHVEETGGDVRVRHRVDGILRQVGDLPAAARRAVLSRIKVMAGMDISVKRRAQDGSIDLELGGRRLNLRVSTLPVNGGEKAVVRILDPGAAPAQPQRVGARRTGPDAAATPTAVRRGGHPRGRSHR
jgi:type IV pilus assembly protein PilB